MPKDTRMSQSTPVCFPKCSQCQRKHPNYDRTTPRRYINVCVVAVATIDGPGGLIKSVTLQCGDCGYVYNSRSSAARRAGRAFLKCEMKRKQPA